MPPARAGAKPGTVDPHERVRHGPAGQEPHLVLGQRRRLLVRRQPRDFGADAAGTLHRGHSAEVRQPKHVGAHRGAADQDDDVPRVVPSATRRSARTRAFPNWTFPSAGTRARASITKCASRSKAGSVVRITCGCSTTSRAPKRSPTLIAPTIVVQNAFRAGGASIDRRRSRPRVSRRHDVHARRAPVHAAGRRRS